MTSSGTKRQRAYSSKATVALPAVRQFPSFGLSQFLIPFSYAIDLAEGRSFGHGQRVSFIATALADVIDATPELKLATCYAALFHDVGIIGASDEGGLGGGEGGLLASVLGEEAVLEYQVQGPQTMGRVTGHASHGARLAQDLGLPEEAARAIATHHERWDGNGYPYGLAGPTAPLAGRIVGAADLIERMIDRQQSPLIARRHLILDINQLGSGTVDPGILNAARSLAASDTFWLGLFSSSIGSLLREQCAALKEIKGHQLDIFAERLADKIDARFDFTAGVSARAARFAEMLGLKAGLSKERLCQLRVAALLHDMGQLGVPGRIMAKPGILSVEELEVMRQHPLLSEKIVAAIPGMEEAAHWVADHHERPDGRGYPEGKSGDELPLEARILSIADAYVAVTSDRPHRKGVSHEDGMRILSSAAGTQLDGELLQVFAEEVVA